MHVIIFQCGWETKSLHTIFSYLFTSLSNDMIFEKTVAHWFFKQSNEIHRGVPPTLDNKKRESDLVNLFLDLLFVYRTQLTHKTKFKRILADTVVRFHDAIFIIIDNELSGIYKNLTHKPFYYF